MEWCVLLGGWEMPGAGRGDAADKSSLLVLNKTGIFCNVKIPRRLHASASLGACGVAGGVCPDFLAALPVGGPVPRSRCPARPPPSSRHGRSGMWIVRISLAPWAAARPSATVAAPAQSRRAPSWWAIATPIPSGRRATPTPSLGRRWPPNAPPAWPPRWASGARRRRPAAPNATRRCRRSTPPRLGPLARRRRMAFHAKAAPRTGESSGFDHPHPEGPDTCPECDHWPARSGEPLCASQHVHRLPPSAAVRFAEGRPSAARF